MKCTVLTVIFLLFFLSSGAAQEMPGDNPLFNQPEEIISFRNVVLCDNVIDGQPNGIRSRFSVTDPHIVLWFQYFRKDTSESLPVSVHWLQNKKIIFAHTTWLNERSGDVWFTLEQYCYRDHPDTWLIEIRSSGTTLLVQDFVMNPPGISTKTDLTDVSFQVTPVLTPVTGTPVPETESDDIVTVDSSRSPVESTVEPPQSGTELEFNASDFNRGNLRKHHPFYSNLTVSGFEYPSWAEYDIEIPVSGDYEIWFAYTAGEPRPTKLYIDGILLTENGLSQVTGGWYQDTVQWHKELETKMSRGTHVLRLDNQRNIPCLQKITLVLISSEID